MKLFKRIYYPIMALLAVLALVFGFITANVAASSGRLSNDFFNGVSTLAGEIVDATDAREGRHALTMTNTMTGTFELFNNVIVPSIRGTGFGEPTSFRQEYTNVMLSGFGANSQGFRVNEGVPVPSAIAHRTVPMPSTVEGIGDEDTLIVHMRRDHTHNRLNSAVLYIPGSVTRARVAAGQASNADVLLLSVNYDSFGAGATNAAQVASMISLARLLVERGTSFQNDILFVIADGGLENALGLRTVLNQTHAFDNVMSRIRFAVDFSSYGNRGPLTVTGASDHAALLRAPNFVHGSSLISEYFLEPTEAAKAVGNIPSISLSNIGAIRNEGTRQDNMDNLSNSVMRSSANAMYSVVRSLGNANLDAIYRGTTQDAVFFSYYNLFTVSYPVVLGYIFAAIILALLFVVIFFGIKSKSFNIFKVLMGALIQVLAVAAGLVASYAIYFLVVLILVGFGGVFGIGSWSSFNLMNPGMLIFSIAIFAVFMVMMYILLKKAFLIKAPDVVRGGVLLTALLAIITGFAAPHISYLFAFLAILQLTAMLVTIFVKDKFKSKTGMGIERLFLYAWPIILVLPLFISALTMSATLSTVIFLPVLLLLFAPLLFGILPYADFVNKKLNRVFNKINRTVRVEEEGEEMVEDEAKKGKFKAETVKRVRKEKVPLNYRSGVGISVVALLSTIALVLFSSFSGGIHSRIVSNPVNMQNFFFDSAFNYVRTVGDGGTASSAFEVRDRQAHRFIDEVVNMSWNATLGAYVAPTVGLPAATQPTIHRDGNRIVYQTRHSGRVRLVIGGTRLVTNITINHSNSGHLVGFFDEANRFEIEPAGRTIIVIYFPVEFAAYIEFIFEGHGGTLLLSFEEFVAGTTMLDNLREVENLRENERTAGDNLRYNMVFRTHYVLI
ncbi:MAG: hypothetical protein FWC82_02275 [Firmicutes bacterium]|nr:hypothetical protein [Bacillota bacterium]